MTQQPCCRVCSATKPQTGPDPCLGWLPGLRFACCGHGYLAQAYLVWDDDLDGSRVIRGKNAVRVLRELGGSPPDRVISRWRLPASNGWVLPRGRHPKPVDYYDPDEQLSAWGDRMAQDPD